MRTLRAVQRRAPVCGWSTARPMRARRAAAGRITATMSGCTVRVRSLQRPWVVFSVGGAQQTARATTARYYGAILRQPSRYHGTPLRHATAAGGSRLTADGLRLAALGGVACVFLLCE